MENQMQEMNSVDGDVCKLPLWKALLEEIESDIHYGKVFQVKYFEEKLKCPRDSIMFGVSVSYIRRALEKRGMYLSGRGQKGEQFVVIQPGSNVNIMRMYSAEASDKMRRALMLGSATPMNMLDGQQKQKHETMLEKIAWKVAMLARRTPPKMQGNKQKLIAANI